MKKHVLTLVFTATFIGFATAQLTLQKVGSNRQKVLSIGSLIEIKLPTKTSRPDCDCSHDYKGYLKKSDSNNVTLALTEETRITMNENNLGIYEKKTFKLDKDSTLTQIPLSKALAINRYSESAIASKKMGGILLFFAILSNLFLAPQLESSEKGFRNGGYVVMGLSMATFLIPNKRTYYFEQPQKKKKTMWKLGN
jgi:hypothetical protein